MAQARRGPSAWTAAWPRTTGSRSFWPTYSTPASSGRPSSRRRRSAPLFLRGSPRAYGRISRPSPRPGPWAPCSLRRCRRPAGPKMSPAGAWRCGEPCSRIEARAPANHALLQSPMNVGPVFTLPQLARDLASGRTASRRLVEGCLANIAAADGEGSRVFLTVHAQQALAAADFHDQMRRHRAPASAYAGIPISVKDLFDLAGDVTTAGSTVLRGAAPAARDAAAVARLKAAGFVVIGRTNMTEFAFSGLGVNPHYGRPLNPWERAQRRVPGGFSSAAAVSVTDSMAFAALGTDTGGSCRIPAALCGIVGFKPTASRIPLAGCYPLCPTLDSAGPLANSVACCAVLDTVLSGEPAPHASPTIGAEAEMSVGGLRFGVLGGYVLEGLVTEVASGWERALRALAKAD